MSLPNKKMEELTENATRIFYIIFFIIIIFSIWAALSYMTHVLFGSMTTSEFFRYFPDHVSSVFQNIKATLVNLRDRIIH